MARRGSAFEVFGIFLGLGCTSFGGPVAHLGYFRRMFVERLEWLSEEDYAALVALCQFLPGPASSQVGFCLGLKRAGALGGLAAWIGFTLPSAALMAAAAYYAADYSTNRLAHGALHGLQLAAVAVVAQAVWQMGRSLCPDTPRRALALLAVAVLALMPGEAGQLMVLCIGALTGWATLDESSLIRHRERKRLAREWPLSTTGRALRPAALFCLGLYVLLLLAALAPLSGQLAQVAAFYRSGALVFGGGHVVLPLLRDAVVTPGWVPAPLFLSGYGIAQAMPGPLFTFASFLGMHEGGPRLAAMATLAIFLPGLLVAAGCLPFWQGLREKPHIAAMMKGLNAAVVGLLGAAFLNLLTITSLQSLWDLPVALFALLLLTAGRARPLLVVIFCAVSGMVLA